MSNRFSISPPYPLYRDTPFTGDLPEPPINPPDLRPSGMNPSYDVYAGERGRTLAGLGDDMNPNSDFSNIDQTNAEGIKDYPNELDLLMQSDDVVGNGVFDPNGSHGNVHPDQGVFQDHLSLPGYVDRDMFYAPSEVVDATTGREIMYVPGGAVAIDESQRAAFEDKAIWELPPSVNPWRPPPVPQHATVDPRQFQRPISGVETGTNRGGISPEVGLFVAAGVVGVAVGLFVATMKGKAA